MKPFNLPDRLYLQGSMFVILPGCNDAFVLEWDGSAWVGIGPVIQLDPNYDRRNGITLG